ncbi:conserved hypothetical protein, partial [Ricinus communis]
MALPAVGHRIVAFHLAEDLGLARHAADEETALAAHGEEAVAIDHQAMARARGGQRRTRLPGVARGKVDVVQVGVVFEGVEAPADHVDQAAVRYAAHVIARAGQRLARAPAVGLRVVDLMPAHAGALGRGLGGAADQVQLPVEHHRGGRAARTRQRRDGGPAVGRDLVDVGIRVGAPVLLDEAAERVDPAAVGRHGHVVGAARQRRAVEPAVGLRVVDVVVVAVDRALAVAADHVHAALRGRGPGHLAARERQRRACRPA